MAIYFFTDTNFIDDQPIAKSYGPLNGISNTQYRVTSKLELTNDAPAYAVCSGDFFIQEITSNPTLINLIVKPHPFGVGNKFTPVDYIIYRGLKKSNFLNSSNEIISVSDPNSTELITSIWDHFNSLKIDNPSITSTSPSSSSIGWQLNSDPSGKLFSEVFYESNIDYQLASLSEGQTIGFFDKNNAGIDIIIKDHLYLPTLNDARITEKIISVSSFNSSDLEGDEDIGTMKERSQILSFIDPCAFFMLYHTSGINYYNSGTKYLASGYTGIYFALIGKFYTRNTLYIDVRNENGYSINYYKDYQGMTGQPEFGLHFKYGENLTGSITDVDLTPLIYYKNYWPIFSVKLVANTSVSFNRINLSFRKEYNPIPILYFDYALVKNDDRIDLAASNSKFQDFPLLGSPNWSYPFEVYAPNITTSATGFTCPTWMIKLYLIKKIHPSSLPSSVISKDFFLDNIFGPVQSIPSFVSGSQWVNGLGKRYINAIKEFGFAGIFEIGVGISSSDVLFYAQLLDYYIEDTDNFLAKSEAINIGITSSITTNPDLLDGINQDAFSNIGLEFKANLRNITGQGKLLHVISNIKEKKFNTTFTLLISRIEYNTIQNLFTSFNLSFHDLYFQFSNVNELLDDDDLNYQKADLNLIGISSSSPYSNFNILPANVDVKSTNFRNFNSDSFVPGTLIKIGDQVFYPITEFIGFVEEVEKTYSSGAIFNDTPDQIVTRIRVHSFGYTDAPLLDLEKRETNFAKVFGADGGYAFNLAVPLAPYIEKNPFSQSPCLDSGSIPDRFMESETCRSRNLYKEYGIVNTVKELDEHVYEKITLSSLKIFDPGNNTIDMGHALYGLCAFLHAKPDGSPGSFYTASPVNINSSLDCTSFIGDLASALGHAYIDKANSPSNSDLDYYYRKNAALSDLRGDVEMFGLYETWKYIKNSSTSTLSLSNVLKHYYNALPLSSFNYKNRWKIFCLQSNMLSISPTITWTANPGSPTYSDLKNRLIVFSNFLYNSFGHSARIGLSMKLYPHGPDLSFYNAIFDNSNSDIDYILNKFLNYVKNELNNEQGYSL